ncbi:MAG: glycosyltransferase [Candidatus Promineifilaceae bacterium]|nr:glycosyltransferase [Candidatus Promineifilaceae bacterium]
MINHDQQLRLHHPPGCESEQTSEGGYTVTAPPSRAISLDERLGRLWQQADGLTLSELSERVTDYRDWQEAVTAFRLAGILHPPLIRKGSPPPLPDPAPLVSVIVPTRNGRRHLAECLPTIQAQSYPNVEMVVVDDHSTDGTLSFLQSDFPDVILVQSQAGSNFSTSCNLGVQHASGDFYFFLNNDTVLDPNCIQELVGAYGQSDNVAGVAAMMRFYHHPAFVNGLGTQQRRFGFGQDIGIGALDVGQFEKLDEVPAVCFGAALVPRQAWRQVGPLDERYQFYYEDADWSFRARRQGMRLVPAPEALVFHKFSATMKDSPAAFKIRLATRNRLWFVTKNYPAAETALQLMLYWLDDYARLLKALLSRQGRIVGAILLAWLQFYWGLPSVLKARWSLERQHSLEPGKLTGPLPPGTGENPFLTEELIARRYLPHLQELSTSTAGTRRRLLIISPDAVHSRMGGVGIRYWELAQQLASVAEVTLAIPGKSDLDAQSFTLQTYQENASHSLRDQALTADVILLAGFTVYHHPFLRELPAYKIVDLYDPMILENLERFADQPMSERRGLHNVAVNAFNQLFQLGDFFICASEKQRDYWLGGLTAANRVNPWVYERDPGLHRLIDLVPFGLPADPPRHTKAVLKGIWPGIDRTDKVILWGGGLWDWLDPLTVIEAMPSVLATVPEARLFFLGTRHPNPAVPESQMAARAIGRAEALGLKDKAIFFNDWTPYQERVNYLSEADVGVSLHGDHVETRFAVRTRLMDYLWANLPMVVGGGDVLSDLVAKHGLGHVVAAGDVVAVAEGLINLLQHPVGSDRFEPVKDRYHWERVAEPLKRYVRDPWTNEGGGRMETAQTKVGTSTPLRQLPGKALRVVQQQGLIALGREIAAYARWLQQH